MRTNADPEKSFNETLAILNASAKAWEETANLYKNALLGERMIVTDVHERVYSVVSENGLSHDSLKPTGPGLTGALLMNIEHAQATKLRLEKEAPSFAPYTIHDFQDYAKSQYDKDMALINSMTNAAKARAINKPKGASPNL